jgi:hypothetical protein
MPGLTDRWLSRNQVVLCSGPANYTGTAATTEWVSLRNYKRAVVKITTGAWAGGTAAVTLNEATAVAGTGSTALGFSYMYTNDAAATAPTLVKTAVTSNTFNLDTASSLYLIEIDADELTEGYDCLNVAIASPGANNDFYSVEIILCDPRYVDAPASLPVGTTD